VSATSLGKTTDRDRLARFWASASGFWRGKSAITGWSLGIGLLVLCLAQLVVQYRLNFWNRDFFNALQFHDGKELFDQAIIFVPLACSSVALKVASVWGRMTAQRKWREWLTINVLDRWLSHDRYRRLASVTSEYQNAEYRISIDARTATDAPVDLAIGFVTAVLSALVFIDVLWVVGGSFSVAVNGVTLTIPGYLVIAVGVYSLAFTGLMMAIGRKLPAVIQVENQAEAEFLAAANQIRESGSRPAAAAEKNENYRIAWETFRVVLVRWRQLCWQLMGTTLVTQTDLLFAPVVAWALCAPKYLNDTMTLGELMQASAAFVTVQLGFNWVVDNYQRLSDWRAAINRVSSLLMALDEVALLEGEGTG
jgi:vitamin B12/bleomycin/antimicrobial peptide transport system ATP-binding/permease protein